MYTELQAPMYGTRDGLPVIVVGVHAHPATSDTRLVVVDGDGNLSKVKLEDVIVDVRFQDDAWHDVSPGPETPEE